VLGRRVLLRGRRLRGAEARASTTGEVSVADSHKLREWEEVVDEAIDALAFASGKDVTSANVIGGVRGDLRKLSKEIFEEYVDAVRAESLPKTG
jgi:Ni,Fe-hydrogenase III large subunit